MKLAMKNTQGPPKMKMKCPASLRRKRSSAGLVTEDTLVFRTGIDRLYQPVDDSVFDDLLARFK
jgi:hypothetical protein